MNFGIILNESNSKDLRMFHVEHLIFSKMNPDILPNFIYLAILLGFLLSSFLFRSNLSKKKATQYILSWLAIFLIVIVIYSLRHDINRTKDKVAAELFPSRAQLSNNNEIIVTASNNGHFYISTIISGKKILFMVDTGASDVALNSHDAQKIGIAKEDIKYFKTYQTANGKIVSGQVTIPEIEIGGIIFKNINASVSDGDMGTSLLGMSFLQSFKSYEFRQNKLILRY